MAKFRTLCARAEVTRKGRRLYFANVTVYAGDEIVATAQGFYAMPSETLISERSLELGVRARNSLPVDAFRTISASEGVIPEANAIASKG